MQLRTLMLAAGLALLAGSAAGQSLSPMRLSGSTPSDVKAFRLMIGNPYKARMVFAVVPMDDKFEVAAANASVSAPQVRLAPGASRPVIVQFRLDPQKKERTIGVCIWPTEIDGPVLPRVCGTYTGRRFADGG